MKVRSSFFNLSIFLEISLPAKKRITEKNCFGQTFFSCCLIFGGKLKNTGNTGCVRESESKFELVYLHEKSYFLALFGITGKPYLCTYRIILQFINYVKTHVLMWQ